MYKCKCSYSYFTMIVTDFDGYKNIWNKLLKLFLQKPGLFGKVRENLVPAIVACCKQLMLFVSKCK